MKFTKIIGKTISLLLSIALVAQTATVSAAISNEKIINSFTATQNGQAVISNLKYSDLTNAGYDLKDAIYQNGALGIFASLGSSAFNQNAYVSKEMALYLVYMAANRAQDINTQGQALNNARAVDKKKTSLQAVLFDGSLQMAANEGLITYQELADAMADNQSELLATNFIRSAAASRQEFATWLAKALMLTPVYEQQELFNNFSDWKNIKPENVPFVEAILVNNIMSGDGSGKFNPTSYVTRQQATRILKNAEATILPLKTMQKRTAIVEDIQSTKDNSKGYRIDTRTFLIRNSDGLLDEITVEARYQQPTTTTNELTESLQPAYHTEIPVFKDGQITSSQSLKIGDRIEYIVGIEDNIVRYARVLSNSGDISYIVAIVNSVNSTVRSINITPLKQTIQYPNEEIVNAEKKTYANGNVVYESYSYISKVLDALTKGSVNIAEIKPESVVILGIKQNMVTELTPVTIRKEREQGIVAGIVEENNPQLGYLTLYNEDGTGNLPLTLSKLRTFNYSDPNSVEVYKNHQIAELDEIEAGDTVFIRIDDSGTITSVSSVTNYSVRYGKVVSKNLNSILVETDKGQQSYNIDGIDIIKDGKLAKYSQLKDGDRVKLLINEAPNVTILKEITVEGGDKLVANIYKGTFSRYDDISDKIILSDPWTLRKGQWVKDVTEPFKTIELSDNFIAYYETKKQAVSNLNTRMVDTTVYVVCEKDYGNGEYGVAAQFVNQLDKEVPYDDRVYNTSTNRFVLEKTLANITYNAGTIVVKDGRLVQGNSISQNDYAYVVANRDSDTGKIVAGVVSIEQRAGMEAVQLYRGRIDNIDEFKSVTLMSFAKLNGNNWEYSNTPLTFALSADTRITDTDGIVGQGDFTSYEGAQTFKDRTIYILADGTNAVEISTAPYGNYNVSGVVSGTTGGTVGETGSLLGQPTSVELRNCKYYDPASHLWVSMKNSSFNFLENTLVLKNNKRINPSELKKGDNIRVLKKDNSITGEAYVIIVE